MQPLGVARGMRQEPRVHEAQVRAMKMLLPQALSTVSQPARSALLVLHRLNSFFNTGAGILHRDAPYPFLQQPSSLVLGSVLACLPGRALPLLDSSLAEACLAFSCVYSWPWAARDYPGRVCIWPWGTLDYPGRVCI
jgi:hypothetical protein